ncbi:MAG TPA: TonB family protein [Terriglobales bacterium]|nr:TonB family protein [Terriglobales bacterium]
MARNTDIFNLHEPWRGPLAASAMFHAGIVGLIFAYAAWMGLGQKWGGPTPGEGTIQVTLASAPSIPLPREAQTDNIVANDSPGVSYSKPKEVAPPETKAIEIPRTIKVPPKPQQHTNVQKRPVPVEQPSNVVAYGEGGQVRQSFATFNTQLGQGSLAMGGGDFGTRYSWYVQQVLQKLEQNWFMYEVDPRTGADAKVTVTFEINRNGNPGNVKVESSSGIASLDQSAVRTLQRIDTFGSLPPEYRGASVDATYIFDYRPHPH